MIVFSWWLVFSKYELKEHWVHLKYAPDAPCAPVFSARLVFLKIRMITFVYLKNRVVFSSSGIHREFHQTSNRFFSTVRFFKIRLNVTRLLRGCFVYWVQNTSCVGQTQFVIWIYGRLLAWSRAELGIRMILILIVFLWSYFHMFKKRVGLQMGSYLLVIISEMSVIKLVAKYLKNICRQYFNWIYKSDSKPSVVFCVGVESTYMYLLVDSLVDKLRQSWGLHLFLYT